MADTRKEVWGRERLAYSFLVRIYYSVRDARIDQSSA